MVDSFVSVDVMKTRQNPKAKKALERTPASKGWATTDEDEILVRQQRAVDHTASVRQLDGADPFYGSFAVQSKSKRTYRVEIRSLTARDNSCDCPDYRKNGLGVCKHIEAVLGKLRGKGRKAWEAATAAGPAGAEVYLSRKGNPEPRLLLPAKVAAAVRAFFAPFFSADGALLADPEAALPALLRAWQNAPQTVRTAARLSREVEEWHAERARRRERERARESFLKDVKSGRQTLDVVRGKLYPYQRDGMLHLAFGERAMLADEMGLGKTVQAIAACELLRRTRRIERVLVVSPASLKAEWEEQIAKFTSLPSKIVWGARAERLKTYREPAFFYLTNYEQARADAADMNRLIAPDVVILDEAQRIKNWQTRTAQTIKSLSSPYAFVLTGTPLENRIDEVYSIVEFLDPSIFGPLFRFNREFYELDDRGKPVGLKNLADLHRRLKPVMLRRRKDEVEDQLPARTITNYFVPMEDEQRARYADYEFKVAQLAAIAKRRPLLKEELEKLMRYLACMRMLCDTPYILDSECRICPKLHELADVLRDIAGSGDSKIIVFSEWERMLQLVRELAREMKLEFAWHTGTVPQKKRREDIIRFKNDPACRLFLSTDSGATGLNLQAANVVINLDLPWNPAKLEQRIARSWRKHQTRAVQVINLVCEQSIESRMLDMLAQKQQLADGVLDGRGDLENIRLPSGRAAFLNRLQALMGGSEAGAPSVGPNVPEKATRREAPAEPPDRAFCQDLAARLGPRLLAVEARNDTAGRKILVAVVDGEADQARPLADRLLRDAFGTTAPPSLELIDRHAYETIRRLIQAGVLKANAGTESLFESPGLAQAGPSEDDIRIGKARAKTDRAERQFRMSALLKQGDFIEEALPSLRNALEDALAAAALLCGAGGEDGPVSPAVVGDLLVPRVGLPADTAGALAQLRALSGKEDPVGKESAEALFGAVSRAIEAVRTVLNKRALGGG
jgi:superfamily II DNA or RNA helicase